MIVGYPAIFSGRFKTQNWNLLFLVMAQKISIIAGDFQLQVGLIKLAVFDNLWAIDGHSQSLHWKREK